MYKIIWTQEKKDLAIEMLTDFFAKYGSGEGIMQSDDALIKSSELLSDIADDILVEEIGLIYIED